MIVLIEVFLFLCVVYYIFNKNRTDDMVDVISTRLQEACGSWRLPGFLGGEVNGTEPSTFERLTTDAIKRFGTEQRRRKIASKENEQNVRERGLYEIKETPVPNIPLKTPNFQSLSCPHCAPHLSEVQLDPNERRREVTDILRVTQHAGWRPDSTIFDWGWWCPFLAQCVRLKKFPLPQVAGTVIKDDRLVSAIQAAAKESVDEKKEQIRLSGSADTEQFDETKYYQVMLKKHERRAKHLLLDMRSKISDLLLRITSWVLYKLLPCFLSGVVAHPAQVQMLQTATERAPGAPLIFLPLHRSHLDYILVSFILLNNDIRSPVVAAGNNLRIPLFGALLRGLGAFFIKRKIDPVTGKKDLVYRALLHTYMQHAVAAGHNVEFFIEGGRTRTGKPCMPKSGILSVIVDAFMDGTISDALLVPVSVNYERLVDGNFVNEQMGKKKQAESFKSAASAIWQVLHSRYGLMRIDFNEPFSIRELVKSFERKPEKMHPSARSLQSNPSTSSLYGTDIVQEEHRILVDSIARHVVYDCASATAVMTTNAVAYILLTRYRDGATLNVIATALDNLRADLEGNKDIGFTGDSVDIVKYVVELLGIGMITKEQRANNLMFIKPVTMLPNVIELAYYSNSLLPHIALDSIMVTALHALIVEWKQSRYQTGDNTKSDSANLNLSEFSTTKGELLRVCMDHCDMLRNEFILHKPCQQLEDLLAKTLDKLLAKDLVSIPESPTTYASNAAQRLASFMESEMYSDDAQDDDANEYGVHDSTMDQLIYVTESGSHEREMLTRALAPIGHTYLAVGLCLDGLINNSMVEAEFIKMAVKEITDQVTNGVCPYGESVSTDSIRNCIKLLEKMNVLEISNSAGVRIVSLGMHYDHEYGVRNITERLQKIVPNPRAGPF